MNRRMFIASMIGGLVSVATGKPILKACAAAKIEPKEVEKLKPRLRYVRLADLKPLPSARMPIPKDHPHFLMLTESIKEMGMMMPITVTTNMMVIDGNCRVVAAKAAGLVECPAWVLDLTKDEIIEHQFMINRQG